MGEAGVQTELRPAAVPPPTSQLIDPGLAGLALIAAYYRIAADPQQLRHQLALTGDELANVEDLVRGANLIGLKSRILRKIDAKRFAKLPLPVIIGMKSGSFAILAVAATKERARIIDPDSAHHARSDVRRTP